VLIITAAGGDDNAPGYPTFFWDFSLINMSLIEIGKGGQHSKSRLREIFMMGETLLLAAAVFN
jgi:hypothetical protein